VASAGLRHPSPLACFSMISRACSTTLAHEARDGQPSCTRRCPVAAAVDIAGSRRANPHLSARRTGRLARLPQPALPYLLAGRLAGSTVGRRAGSRRAGVFTGTYMRRVLCPCPKTQAHTLLAARRPSRQAGSSDDSYRSAGWHACLVRSAACREAAGRWLASQRALVDMDG